MKKFLTLCCIVLLCSYSKAQEKSVWVSDLNLSLFDLDMGQATKNKTMMGSPLIISGTTFENGVGTMAPSKCLIDLNGAGIRFLAEVGPAEMKFRGGGPGAPAPGGNAAPAGPGGAPAGGAAPPQMRKRPDVEFFVLGDKKILWQSGAMKEGDKAKPIDVDVKGIQKLALVAVTVGGESGGMRGGMAVWGNAKISYAGETVPKIVSNAPVIASDAKILTPSESEYPKINYPKVVGATPSKPFIFSIPVTGKKPLTVSVEGLPSGLKLDASSGIISGTTPEKKGTYTLNVKVKNALGEVKGQIDLKVGDLLALTPPMGWNSWNAGGMSVDQNKVKAAADVISEKLRGHGWMFINIDDGWQAEKRTESGELLTNEKFSDIKGMSDYIHARGMRFGIYSSPGPQTCGRALGSYQHEEQDAATWAKWGVDYLKYDWCSYRQIQKDNSLEELKKPYFIMRDALAKSKRDIVYSLCQYGMGDVWNWGAEVGGNLWRTTGDINDSWKSVLGTGFTQTNNFANAGPGHWNDPDMLVIGQVGWSKDTKPTKLSPDEQYAHISLWSLLSSPLLIGCEMDKLDNFTLGLITNDEVIGVNQDALGQQARLVKKGDDYQVWAKDLADGSKAVGLFYTGKGSTAEKDPVKMINWGDEPTESIKLIGIDFSELGLSGNYKARNLWAQQDIGIFKNRFEAEVNYHGVVLVKLQLSK
jgi:alpha-galactosidase